MSLHRGADRRASGGFSNSESLEYFRLACFSRAAVTAHRWNNERLAAARFYCIDDAGDQFDKTAHPATAGSDGNARVWLQTVEKPGLE